VVPESVGEDCDEEAQFIGSQDRIFTPKYIETGTGSESEAKETRAREDHIKNLPVGQMEILMVDSREGTLHSHLHVRRAPSHRLDRIDEYLYPKMHSLLDPGTGVNLRFKDAQNRRQRRRRVAESRLKRPMEVVMRRLSAIQLSAAVLLFCAIAPAPMAQTRTVQPQTLGKPCASARGSLTMPWKDQPIEY